jgi:hypothetical protein
MWQGISGLIFCIGKDGLWVCANREVLLLCGVGTTQISSAQTKKFPNPLEHSQTLSFLICPLLEHSFDAFL